MVAKAHVKLLIWVLLVALLSGTLFLVLGGIAHLLAYFQQGADPATALHIEPNVPPDLHVRLTWLPDDADTGRTLEPFTREQLQAAYLRAWLQWNISYLKATPTGLKSYFEGAALNAVNSSLTDAATRHWSVTQADTIHTLRLHFYSADGSVVSFTDEDALVMQSVRDAHGEVLATGETRATYDVVLFLNDGAWHIRNLVRTAGVALDNTLPAPDSHAPAGIVRRDGTHLTRDGAQYTIAGMNYYPEATPWDLFWPHYDSAVIDRDFNRMRGLGINTVRVFVPFAQFGGANVDPRMSDRLANLLDRARAHDLTVIVTLFDFHAEYSPLLWPDADRQLETLLTRFRDDPTILAWDLKNEPDRDYHAAGRDTVEQWLAHTARLAREYDPNHLLTIGWSTPAAAHALPELVDFVSYHYYEAAAKLPAQYQALRALTDRPIVLEEFGATTFNSFFLPFGHSEQEQAVYYAEIGQTMRQLDGAGALAWTLYDFPHVPASVAGRLPWRSAPQHAYGVLRADGTPKPAAAFVTQSGLVDVPTLPASARLFKPFNFTVIFALILGTTLVTAVRGRWLRRHRRQRRQRKPMNPPPGIPEAEWRIHLPPL